LIGSFKFKSLILFILFLLGGCRSSLPESLSKIELRDEIHSQRIPLVFVPGIKGSVLKDQKNATMWLTAFQALGLSTPDLSLKKSSNPFFPVGAIERVTLIPYIVDVALYGPWLERMTLEEDFDFYVFSYDWRKDNINSRDALKIFLEKISKAYKHKPVLVGHSMGGMLSFSVINSDPDLVDKVVLVGVPFRGGIGYMKDLYSGNSTGFNSKIQAPCTIVRYESVYSFFPRLNTKDSQGLVLDDKGKPIPIDFFAESSWRDNKLGFYGNHCQEDDTPSQLEFQNILNRAKLFRESLDLKSTLLNKSPQALVVNANNRQTRKFIQHKDGMNLPSWEIDNTTKSDGDGSVLFEHSLPPEGFKYKMIQTEYEHSLMLNDKSVQNQILNFLRN